MAVWVGPSIKASDQEERGKENKSNRDAAAAQDAIEKKVNATEKPVPGN